MLRIPLRRIALRLAPRSPARALFAAATLLALAAPPARAQLSTDFELKDGEVLDIAGQGNGSVSPASKRVWLAQGRVRVALRVSDGQRMTAEDRIFTDTGIEARPLSIEVDDGRQLLYTLTEGKYLYRESIADPTNPVQTGWFDLRTVMPANSTVRDLKLWRQAPDDAVFVLCSDRLFVLRDVAGTLTLISQALETFPLTDSNLPPGVPSINDLEVSLFDRMTVHKDGNRMVAYIVAYMGGYELPVEARPFPRLMLLCDLDLATGYLHPNFRRWAGSYSHFLFANFTPCPPAPGGGPCLPPGEEKYDYSANDIAVTGDGASRIAYVACGKRAQLQRVDVTDAYATGTLQVLSPVTVDPLPPADAHHLNRVRVDRSNPKRVYVTLAKGALHVLDVTNPTSPANASTGTEEFGPSLGDLHVMAMPARPQTVWAATGSVDHTLKITDVVASPPVVFDERYWPYRSDGAVAIPPNAIYLPTFTGVARYKPSGSGWVPDPLGFQPAEVPLGSGQISITEHIALGVDVAAPGDHRLFTATAVGGFNEFRLDGVLNPLPPSKIDPPSHASIDPGWLPPGQHQYFGNDVAVAQVQGQTFVLTDLMNRSTNQAALIAYVWKPVPQLWSPIASAVWNGTPGHPGGLNTDVIDVARGVGNRAFAFVNHTTGFASLDLSNLVAATPSIGVVSVIQTFDPANAGKRCRSLAHSRDRLFVGYQNATLASGGIGGRIEVHAWDGTTGVVTAPGLVTSLDNNQLCALSGGADCSFSGAFRLRYLTTNLATGCGLLHACDDGGIVHEFKYDHGTPSPLDDVLGYAGYWRSFYSNSMQDAHAYDFGSGPRILAVKDAETFALVKPAAVSCP